MVGKRWGEEIRKGQKAHMASTEAKNHPQRVI